MINRSGLGIACALGAAVLYGFVPNFARGALDNGVPPVESTLIRTTIVAILLSSLASLRAEPLRIPRAALPAFIGQAAATLTISVGYMASLQFIPVGLSVIIFYTFPVLIMLAAPLIEGQSPGLRRILIALVAFAGLAVAVGPGFESLDMRGIALAAASAFACALQFFSGRALSKHMKPAAFGGLVHIAIWPVTLFVALYASQGSLALLPGGGATPMGYAFVFGVGFVYLVAYLVHMSSVRFAAASIVAPYYNLEPVLTTLIAAYLFHERLAINQYVGGGMVLAALLMSSLAGLRKAEA